MRLGASAYPNPLALECMLTFAIQVHDGDIVLVGSAPLLDVRQVVITDIVIIETEGVLDQGGTHSMMLQ